MKTALSAMTVKTDRKDARGIAQLLRLGWYQAVHAKSLASQDTRAVLVGRKMLLGKVLDVELSIRGILHGYGLKVGEVSRGRFEAPIDPLRHCVSSPAIEKIAIPFFVDASAVGRRGPVRYATRRGQRNSGSLIGPS